MAEFNRNQNGVFGEIKFNGNNNDTENTSFFEGTIPGNDFQVGAKNLGTQGQNAGNVFASFGTSDAQNEFKPIEQNKAIAKPSVWSKMKSFLFQEIDLKQEIRIELSPKEEKVLNEVHDFLFQEVSFKGFKRSLKNNK